MMKTMKKTKQDCNLILLLSIMLLALVLRIYQLSKMPPSLNRDEASLAYNAYSLLKTGRDEHGRAWPLQLESFGDWKLGGYVYSLLPLIAIFGLKDWVVKLPSLLAGLAIVYLFYALLRVWTKNKRLALLASLLAAISPWLIHFSRVAYEVNLALAFYMGFLLNVGWLAKWKTHQHKCRLVSQLLLSIVLASLSVFTYHAFQLITPLTVIYLLLKYRRDCLGFVKKRPWLSLLAALLLTFFIVLFIASGAQVAGQTKLAGLSILDRALLKQQVAEQRQYFIQITNPWSQLLFNKLTVLARQVWINVGQLFSLNFLFVEGGSHGIHDIAGVGNLLPVMLPLIVLGLIDSLKSKHWWQVLVLYLAIITSLPALLTLEAGHSTRSFALVLPLIILAAQGLDWLYSKWTYYYLALLLLVFQVANFMTTYLVIAPQRDINNYDWQAKQLVNQVWAMKDDYEFVIFEEVRSTPYVYFLYYLAYDPALLVDQLEYYDPDQEGFQYVKRLENIYFLDNQQLAEELVEQSTGLILDIFESDRNSLDLSQTLPSETIDRVKHQQTEQYYKLVELRK